MKSQLRNDSSVLTPQRTAVLQAVRQSQLHLTASEVYESARKILPSISYATVYNSLRYLKDGGFIGEIRFGNGASRYDAMTDRHDHALCTACGKLVDLEMELSDDLMNLAAGRSGFEPHSIELTLKGLCDKCRTK
jgi:Fe2+ or Zn2+ uptake regulation protein